MCCVGRGGVMICRGNWMMVGGKWVSQGSLMDIPRPVLSL